MELIEAIKSRRSIRQYEEGFVIPFEDLKKIIEAGMYAPSAMRRMPWEFLVITDQVLLSTIEKTHNYAAFATSAGAMIAVCLDKNKEHAGMGVIDVSLASQNMMLMAHEMGYGTCYCGVYPERHEEFNKILQVPPHVDVIGLISIGKPLETKGCPPRYDENKVHINKW